MMACEYCHMISQQHRVVLRGLVILLVLLAYLFGDLFSVPEEGFLRVLSESLSWPALFFLVCSTTFLRVVFCYSRIVLLSSRSLIYPSNFSSTPACISNLSFSYSFSLMYFFFPVCSSLHRLSV
jgi:hypothetical protein